MSMDKKRVYGKYYLGLDIGTDSVGWAASDLDYNLLKFHGKSMWGSRLFEEANTSAERRTFRIARRRVQRRSERLGLLQDLFSPAIMEKDPQFFVRLQESMLHEEDKSYKNKNSLFADAEFDDKAYHAKYPTIYHLRSELIHSDQPHDVRLVYLAIHHIMKYRGHFLFEGDLSGEASFDEIMKTFEKEVEDTLETPFECSDIQKMKECLANNNMSRTDKQKDLFAMFHCKANSPAGSLLKAITGSPVKVSAIFPDSGDTEDDTKIEFASDIYEELKPKLEGQLGENYYIIEKAQAIHDWAKLEGILHGNQYLSDAKKEVYIQHKADLQQLKKLVRKFIPGSYKDIFCNPDLPNNYCAYSGVAKINGKKVPIKARCKQQAEFIKFISGKFKGIGSDEELDKLRKKCELGTFMPKLKTKDNSVVPNQLHMAELKKILENAEKYLPFLRQTDGDGLTVSDKILQLLVFRIPYYVGPLNTNDPKAKNTWAERRLNERIYPWNFDKVIDIDTSAQRFISRMTAECTYLQGEDVLPQNSILYSRFMVLNELNKLRIQGEPISVELKQSIFEDCFLRNKKVTLSSLIRYLKARGFSIEKGDITGIDDGFHTSMKSLIEMKEVMGNEYQEAAAEEIIRLSTVLGNDERMLKRKLQNDFGEQLSRETIQRIARKRYTGWGRLSAKFLTGIYDSIPVPETGEYRNIISQMWESNENLMQVLGREHGFADAVNAYNQQEKGYSGFQYSQLEDLYVSPSIKRSIWQSLMLVKEVRKITGHDPEKVFIEMARGGGEKNTRTESRKNKLLALYKACKDETRDWLKELSEKDESSFRSDRLYLYYTQMGKCMYTGEPIDLDKLYDNTVYDIDHIFPQSKIKDDSLDNRVLVKRIVNAEKTDNYPIDKATRDRMHAFWSMLMSKDLISKKKFERLVRSTPLSDDELSDFVARQLVETRQATKVVAEILKKLLPDTTVVYVKAGLVTDFRHDYDMLKCREINDLHHAKDAYLNIVVGNVYNTKFTNDPRNFFREPSHQYSLKRMYDFDVVRGQTSAWHSGEQGSIVTVRKMMQKNNVLVTKMILDRKGQMFNIQLVKKNQWQLPMKKYPECLNNPAKYGGYSDINGAYMILVEHSDKNKRIRSFVDMPIHISQQAKNEEMVIQMLEAKGFKQPKIIVPHIGYNSLIEIDGFRMYLTGKSGTNQLLYAGAHQLIMPYEFEKYMRKVLKLCERVSEYAKRKQVYSISEYDGITSQENKELYVFFKNKLENTVYRIRLSNQAANLKLAQNAFERLSLIDQCSVLKEILNLFTCNRVLADLSLLLIYKTKREGSQELSALPKNAGAILTSRNMTNYESVKMISQSITGLFETERDLLK